MPMTDMLLSLLPIILLFVVGYLLTRAWRKGSRTAVFLMVVGIASFVGSIIWFLTFAKSAARATGGSAGMLLDDNLVCLFYTTAPCAIATTALEFGGQIGFRPYLTWIAIGCFLFAAALTIQRHDRSPR